MRFLCRQSDEPSKETVRKDKEEEEEESEDKSLEEDLEEDDRVTIFEDNGSDNREGGGKRR